MENLKGKLIAEIMESNYYILSTGSLLIAGNPTLYKSVQVVTGSCWRCNYRRSIKGETQHSSKEGDGNDTDLH